MPALVTAPVYCQLSDALRDLIRRGEFGEGERFLTERQIGERFGVSRATANKALSNLVSEGVVTFKKGVGTFVRGGVLDYDLRALVSFTEKSRAAGREPSTRVLAFRQLPSAGAPPGVQAALSTRAGVDRLFYMERLRMADGMPVILERRHLVARFCPGLDEAALNGSLYAVLTERFRLEISGADEAIRAVAVTDADAEPMQMPAGAAALLVTSVGYLSGGVPLWHEETLYRGDAYEFRNRLGPIQTARPAAGTLLPRPAPSKEDQEP